MYSQGKTRSNPLAAVFVPAVGLMNRLGYAAKFILIGALLLSPFALVTTLQYRSAQHDIDFNQYESWGVTYITPVEDFLHMLQKRRVLMVASLTGMGQLRGELPAVTDRIDKQLASIDTVDNEYGDILQT